MIFIGKSVLKVSPVVALNFCHAVGLPLLPRVFKNFPRSMIFQINVIYFSDISATPNICGNYNATIHGTIGATCNYLKQLIVKRSIRWFETRRRRYLRPEKLVRFYSIRWLHSIRIVFVLPRNECVDYS